MSHQIYREATFCAAHRLTFHKGLCKFIHGHEWRLQVWVGSNGLNKNGMVLDFKDLDTLMKEKVVDKLDHSLLCYIDDAVLMKIVDENKDFKAYSFPFETTAENLARWIYEEMEKALPSNVSLVIVKLWESPKSCAMFTK